MINIKNWKGVHIRYDSAYPVLLCAKFGAFNPKPAFPIIFYTSLLGCYQPNRFGCGNVSADDQTIELAWNAHAFHSVENNREGPLVYK